MTAMKPGSFNMVVNHQNFIYATHAQLNRDLGGNCDKKSLFYCYFYNGHVEEHFVSISTISTSTCYLPQASIIE